MSHISDKKTEHFIEGSTPRIGYTLRDAAGDVITAALDAQTASIYDEATGTVVGTWTDTDINGAQGNSVAAGVGTWNLPASATAKIGTAEFEDHIIAITFTYGSARVGKHFIKVRVYRQAIGG